MQWKKSYYIATNVRSRKGATTFGDLPDWLYDCPRDSEATLKNMGKWITWVHKELDNSLWPSEPIYI